MLYLFAPGIAKFCHILILGSFLMAASSVSSVEEIDIPDNAPPAISNRGGFIVPAFVHRDFLTEAECILFESMGVTVWCKSWVIFYRLVFHNDLLFAAVRYNEV